MKYLLMVYLSQENWNACSDTACAEYAQKLVDKGVLLAADPLHSIDTATTVKVRNQTTLVTDGPFAETKELLAGFYLVEAAHLDEAIEIAQGIPPAQYGSIEVRPVRDLQL